ncbi:MAG: hypothetical protein KGL18_07950, partial [Burkholderiales bacterium]|nr:hypothetical protein [Burkholderiales bacterium]
MASRKTSAAKSNARSPARAAASDAADAAADAHASIVVYVHGIGAQSPRGQLKLEWDLALFGRDLGARSRMAYWADILHPARQPAALSRRRAARGDAAPIDPDALL